MRTLSLLPVRLLALLAALAWLPGPVTAAETSVAAVERLHASLLDVMQHARDLGYDGRYAKLDPVVRDVYDMDKLARFALGRYWKDISADQQRQFVDVFAALSVATYAARFDGYSGESFKTETSEPLENGDEVVRTSLLTSDGPSVHLDYVLHDAGGGTHRIVNVIADGVSELATRRAEYGNVMKQGGFDALMAQIKDKIAHYRTSSAP